MARTHREAGHDGKKGSKDPNKILKYNNQERYTDKSKANAFADYYTNTSSLKTNKEDRRIHKENCEILRTPVVEGMETSDYTPEELDRAIDQMTTEFDKNMPLQGRERLLKIINASWHRGYTPNMWRRAIIIPLLKKDKDAEKVASYRPVSLTSCLGKIMERMVAARMMYLLEKDGKLNSNQAGFRALHSTEDQTIKLSQMIHNGFQQKPSQRTVLALLDFSKAFDKVWRVGLMRKLINIGLPHKMIAWINSFLRDRRAKVRINNTLSKSRSFKQGVPQGAILSPLLFLVYINDITETFSAEEICQTSMFADDIAVWCTHRSKESATMKLQLTVDKITSWSKRWKLELNPLKCETMLFTQDPGEYTGILN